MQLKNKEEHSKHPLIGEVVKMIRTELGAKDMTQAQFATLIGVTRSMVTHCESSNVLLSDEVMCRISTVFGRDAVEQDIILRKLRRAALYTRKPDAYSDLLEPSPDDPEMVEMVKNSNKLSPALCLKLQEAMVSKGLSSSELADLVSISPRELRVILEGGKSILNSDLKRICEAVDCNYAEFEIGLGLIPTGIRSAMESHLHLSKFLVNLEDRCQKGAQENLLDFLEKLIAFTKKE